MGAAENVEGLLEIAVVGECPAIAGKQRLVAGVGDCGLFEHRDGLRPLSGRAERPSISQSRVGILRIGAIAFLGEFDLTPRVGGAGGLGRLTE